MFARRKSGAANLYPCSGSPSPGAQVTMYAFELLQNAKGVRPTLMQSTVAIPLVG